MQSQDLNVNGPPESGTAAPAGTGNGSDNITAGDALNYRNADTFASLARDAVLGARLEYAARAGLECGREWLDYVRANNLDVAAIGGFVGGTAVLPIKQFSGDKFEFAAPGNTPAFVIVAYGECETDFLDFVAWPLSAPDTVLSMFGRIGLLGAWNAVNAATYSLGGYLEVHRTPLDWLRAGCRGSAIVNPRLAARQLFDLPGKCCGQDYRHSSELLALADGLLDRKKFLTPVDDKRRAAA